MLSSSSIVACRRSRVARSSLSRRRTCSSRGAARRLARLFRAAARPGLLEDDDEAARRLGPLAHRLDHDVDGELPSRKPELELVGAHRRVLLGGLVERGAQIDAEVAMDEVEELEARRPGRRLEIMAGAAGEVQHLEVLVHDDVGRRVALRDALGARARGSPRRPASARGAGSVRAPAKGASGNSGISRVARVEAPEDARPPVAGANSFGCRVTFSELPRKRKRFGRSAKWKSGMTRLCSSPLR